MKNLIYAIIGFIWSYTSTTIIPDLTDWRLWAMIVTGSILTVISMELINNYIKRKK